jgi:hypothetical protein
VGRGAGGVGEERLRGLDGRRRRGPAAGGQCCVGGVSERGVGGKKERTGTLISSCIAGNFAERFALTAAKSTPRVAVENELRKSSFCAST